MSSPARNAAAFPPLLLTAPQLAELRARADSAVSQALRESWSLQRRYKDDWTPPPSLAQYHTKYDVLAEFKPPGQLGPTVCVSKVFGTVEAHYAELLSCLKSQSREDYFNPRKQLFPLTADAYVFDTVRSREHPELQPNEAVTWTSFGLFPLRGQADQFTFETTGEGIDAQGEPHAFHVAIPAEFAEWTTLAAADTSRIIDSVVIIVTRPSKTNQGCSDVFIHTHNDFRCSLVHERLHKRLRWTLPKLAALRASNQVATSPWVYTGDAWVASTSSTSCSLCRKAFCLLRAKNRCGVCSRIVCRKCVLRASQFLDAKVDKHQVVDLASKVCTPCARGLCGQPLEPPLRRQIVAEHANATTRHLRVSPTASYDTRSVEEIGPSNRRPRHARAPTQSTTTTTKMDCVLTPPANDAPQFCYNDGDTPSTASSSPPPSTSEPPYDGAVDGEDDPVDADDAATLSGNSVFFAGDMSDMENVHGAPQMAASMDDRAFSHLDSRLQEQAILLQQMRVIAAVS